MNPEDKTLADDVVAAYSATSMNSARSQQSQAHVLGPSDLGGCRAYLAHMLAGTPHDVRAEPPTAAFIGTAVGEHLEAAYVARHPNARSQVKIKVTLPSGRETEGTADVIDPGVGVIDFKTRDGLTTIARQDPPLKNLGQVMLYLLGAIQMGLLPRDAKWYLVYFDRSGEEPVPVVKSGTLDMDVIAELEERLDQAEYAAMYDLNDVPKDEPAVWCERFCEVFKTCRGDWQPDGLITHPIHLAATDLYAEGHAMEGKGKKMKNEAKKALKGVQGSTGSHVVRWVNVNEAQVRATVRPAHQRLDIRPVKDA